MAIMELSKPNNAAIYDEIRKMWVVAHPEERVRQALLKQMVHTLHFPKELIAVEMHLNALPFLSHLAPDRRADVLVFGKNIHPLYSLYPLLLIECKRGPFTQKALDQLMGYNHYVKAAFVALACKEQLKVAFCHRKGEVQLLSFLPSYDQLLKAVAQEV